MPLQRTVTNGIVLRETNTRENDKILTVLTPMGKWGVIARRARGRNSRLAAAAQLLAYSELTLTEGRTWLYLSEAVSLELFQGLRQDIQRLSLASYFAELTEAVTDANMDCRDVLRLLLNALYALAELPKPQALVKAAFEWKLMALSGFAPLANSCAVCGRLNPQAPVLDVFHSIVHCRGCAAPPRGKGIALSPPALGALRYVLDDGSEKRLYSFRLPDGDLQCFSYAAEAYVLATLDRKFRTLDFYRSLCPAVRKDAIPL